MQYMLGCIKEHRPFGLREHTRTKNLFLFKDKNTKIRIERNSRASSLWKNHSNKFYYKSQHGATK